MGFSKSAGWGQRPAAAVAGGRPGRIQTAMGEIKAVIAQGNPHDGLAELKQALQTLNATVAASNPNAAIQTLGASLDTSLAGLGNKIDQGSVKPELGALLVDVKALATTTAANNPNEGLKQIESSMTKSNRILETGFEEIAKALSHRSEHKPGKTGRES